MGCKKEEDKTIGYISHFDLHACLSCQYAELTFGTEKRYTRDSVVANIVSKHNYKYPIPIKAIYEPTTMNILKIVLLLKY